MQCLLDFFFIWIIFYYQNLSLRCHEALINLSPHLRELNLAATTLTHLKISKEHFCNYKTIFNHVFLSHAQ